jgi:hypothetical protein
LGITDVTYQVSGSSLAVVDSALGASDSSASGNAQVEAAFHSILA